jgi:hypothetical protein
MAPAAVTAPPQDLCCRIGQSYDGYGFAKLALFGQMNTQPFLAPARKHGRGRAASFVELEAAAVEQKLHPQSGPGRQIAARTDA